MKLIIMPKLKILKLILMLPPILKLKINTLILVCRMRLTNKPLNQIKLILMKILCKLSHPISPMMSNQMIKALKLNLKK